MNNTEQMEWTKQMDPLAAFITENANNMRFRFFFCSVFSSFRGVLVGFSVAVNAGFI